MRDPTRGGVAADAGRDRARAGVGIEVDEAAIPVRDAVRGACEILGLDPLLVANEGKLVAVIAPQDVDRVLGGMRARADGRDAQIIGVVVEDPERLVVLKTRIGGRRIVDMLQGDQLPRIC